MPNEMTPKLVVATKNENNDFQLTSQERRLIANFRAMRKGAQSMFVEMSEQYKRTLPAEPVKLQLL